MKLCGRFIRGEEMNLFHIPTKICFGNNALEQLASLDGTRICIIADPFVAGGDLIQPIIRILSQAGKEYVVHAGVSPDPSTDLVRDGVTAYVQGRCDAVVGVGGGSTMDTAKAIRKIAVGITGQKNVPLVCIPTTSGTGSEVTPFAVISNLKTDEKVPLVSPDMAPNEAILDARMVTSMPAGIAAATGMDTMAHVFEAYVSRGRHDFSDALAEKTVEICGRYLYRSFAGTDPEAREKMQTAATMAGMAFGYVGVGAAHSMAHQLGAHFGIMHGQAVALLLPLIIEYNSDLVDEVKQKEHLRAEESTAEIRKRYAALSKRLDLPGIESETSLYGLCSALRRLSSSMKLPGCIREMVPDLTWEAYDSRIEIMARNAMLDPCTQANPREPSEEDYRILYRKIW